MTIEVTIIGGSGYTGGELLRLLLIHPQVTIKSVTSRRLMGTPVTIVHPNLRKFTDLKFEEKPDLDCDVVFTALPHKTSFKIVPELLENGLRVIDLSADYRLDAERYAEWYIEHPQPDLLEKAVYGLPEVNREKIKNATLVACPGCMATAGIFALYPLRDLGEDILIEAKIGSSAAGGKVSESSHHPERCNTVRAYAPVGHRHQAEIEMIVGRKVKFSAIAIDMVRGILATAYIKTGIEIDQKEIWKRYREQYKNELFIRLVKMKTGLYRYPDPKVLIGSNFCDVGFEIGKEILVAFGALDNMVKGGSGQATQNMNIMFGFEETTGLLYPGLHPA